MNRLRQYITPLTASLLAILAVFTPILVFAADSDSSFIQKLVWTVLINISGMFLSAAGVVFDFAINSFVIGFADYYRDSGVGFAVDRTWVTIRDFVNLFFIFGLVYIGFKMILDSDDSNTRRWLVNLIIAALLINFSLFITKFVVDFSNQISTQIAISGFCENGICPTGENLLGVPDAAIEIDMTDNILKLMGISSLFGIKSGGYSGFGWGYIFGTTIMFMVTAFVLFTGAFLLIIRFAMLNLFMVLSPFMFIGLILPPLSSITSKYWNAFLGRAFFAPVYFLFLYFSLEILKAFRTSVADLSSGQSANMFGTADAAETISATQSTLPFFILICIFLIASIVIAQKIGADAASFSQRQAGKLTAGTLGRLGRNTVGRGANRVLQSERLKEMSAKGGIVSRNLAGGTLAAAGYGAKSNYDVRGVIPKNKFVDLGAASKSSFKKELDTRVKREKERAEELGTIDTDKGEGKVAAALRTQELKSEATEKINDAQINREEFEKDKLKTEDELVLALTALTDEIKKDEEALEKGIADKTLTEKEQEEAQISIDAKRNRLLAKQKNTKLSQVGSAREKARLDLSLAVANGANPQEQAEAREALQKAEAAYNEELEQRDSEIRSADQAAKKDFAEAEGKANAQIKYQRQIAFMQQKRDSVWNKKFTGTGGAVVGGLATLAGAGATLSGAGALLGFGEVGAYSTAQKEALKALEKEYGLDGTKKAKKEQTKKAAQELMESVTKESGKEGGKKDKEDDE